MISEFINGFGPLVIGKDFVLAGFREKEWQEKLL